MRYVASATPRQKKGTPTMANRVKIQLMGNLGADPEARVLEDGTSIASFSLAVNDWRGRAKGGETITTWYRVTAWRRQAEIVADLLRKGMNVYVEGGFQPKMYTNRAGEHAMSLDVTLGEFEILTAKNAPAEGDISITAAVGASAEIPDDDIPF
jgi:single-strand DNA-binding protein